MHAWVDDVLGDDDVGPGEDGFGLLLVAGLPVEAVVVGLALEVGTDHRGVRRERRPHVDDRLEDVVLDLDQLQCVACGVTVLGDDERDLLALEAHLVGGQHGLDVVGQGRHPGQALLGQVGSGDHRLDLGVRLGSGHVDADDVRVGYWRPEDREVEHPLELDVVDVLAHAADEARVLLAQHPAMTHRVLVVVDVLEVFLLVLHGRHESLPTVSAAWSSACLAAAHCTDRTMVV